jgi:ATP-dependent Clp protease protease subunit
MSLNPNDLNLNDLSSLPDPYVYEYYKNIKNRMIVINSDIGDDVVDNVIMPLLEMDNDGSGKEIAIYLNTPGGHVYNGLALCSVIERLKTPTKIIVLGYAMSMGALILMSGKNNPNVTRYCYPFTIGLIHGGSTYIEGTTMQVKDYNKFNDRYEETIKDFILNNSNINEEEYEKKTRYEWYLLAEDMLKYGLIDVVL